MDAKGLGGCFRFREARLRPRRVGRRLPVGEIDDPDAVALLDQPGERAAAGDLNVVGMGADGDDVEGFGKLCCH